MTESSDLSQTASESVGRARHPCFSLGGPTGQNPTQVVGECQMILGYRLDLEMTAFITLFC